MARSGLRKEVRTVRGKHGTVRRSYWVKATEAVQKHKGKIAGAAVATAALAGLAYGHKHSISGAYHAARLAKSNNASPFHEAALGWRKATKKHGNLTQTAGKVLHKHLGTKQGRARVKNTLKDTAHTVLSSEMGAELAGHFGTALGGLAGAKLSSRRHRLGGAAVGAIVGKHLGEAAASRAAKHLKTRKR